MFRLLHQWLGRFLGVITTEPAKDCPEAVLNTHKMALQKQIAAYDRALAARAGFCEVLRGQASKLEMERDRLCEALERQAKAPVPDATAGELALRWEANGKDLSEVRSQLEKAMAERNELAGARDQAIQAARQKLAELKGTVSREQEIARSAGGDGGKRELGKRD